MFIDGLIPLLTYAVLCDTTKEQKLLERKELVSLLLASRNTRRIVFKNFRGAAERVLRCFVNNNSHEKEARVSARECESFIIIIIIRIEDGGLH